MADSPEQLNNLGELISHIGDKLVWDSATQLPDGSTTYTKLIPRKGVENGFVHVIVNIFWDGAYYLVRTAHMADGCNYMGAIGWTVRPDKEGDTKELYAMIWRMLTNLYGNKNIYHAISG